MLRKWLSKILLVFLISSAALTAYAGLHFVGSVRVGFGSLTATANIAGFGRETGNVTVTLTATGTNLTALCQNRGGNIAPGHSPVNINVIASQIVRADRNGRATVDFHVDLKPSSRNAGCPNGNWQVIDLLGTLHVNLHALNANNGDSDSADFTCTINEPLQSVQCSPA